MYLTLARRYQHVHVDTKNANAMFDCLRYTLQHDLKKLQLSRILEAYPDFWVIGKAPGYRLARHFVNL